MRFKILFIFIIFNLFFKIGNLNNVESPIPGMEIIGGGFDSGTNKQTGFQIVRNPISYYNVSSNFCCEDRYIITTPPCLCWLNPLNGVPYFMSNVTKLTINDYGRQTNFTKVVQNITQFYSYYSHETDHKSLFSTHTKKEEKLTQDYFEFDSYFSMSGTELELYTIQFAFNLPGLYINLTNETLKLFESLPQSYNSSKESDSFFQYRRAIKSLGTHYIFGSTFGGYQKMILQFNKCLLDEYGEEYIEDQSQLLFVEVSSKDSISTSINQDFYEHSQFYIDYKGGFPFKYNLTQFKEWSSTVGYNPIPLSYNLVEISDLIKLSTFNNNNQIALNYQQAVKDYYKDIDIQNQNYINNLKNKYSQNNSPPSWCI